MRYFFITFLFFSFSVSSQIPDGYYSSATGSGYTLKSQLHDIIDGHNTQGYGALWNFYSSYELDNYYENDGTILDIYSENPTGTDPYNFNKIADQCGNYSGEGDCYNREHSFPRSWFGGDVEPMNSDVHHIFASDGRVNAIRGSFPYGEVASATTTTQNGSKVGSGTSAQGYTGTVFEPIDEFKGDVARAHFYMATRYEDVIAGWENNSGSSDAVLSGTSNQVFEDWVVDLLLSWHASDPVSQKEIDRNDNAYYNHQGNRNPFVDHPEWVNEIWGGGSVEPTIDEISTVKSGTNGQEFTIEGIVTTPDYGGSSGQYFVQDGTGGINIFHSGFQGLVSIGDEVRLTGVRSEFNSIIQLEPSSVTILSSGNTAPSPTTITESDLILNGPYDGTLVRLSGVTLDDPAEWPTTGAGSGASVNVTVGSTSFVLRIDDASFYFGTSAPSGNLVVTGILSRFNNDVQILPFENGDVEEEVDLNPTITMTPMNLSFSETAVGEESSPMMVTIGASDLSESLAVSVSGDYKVSEQMSSGFTSSLDISPIDGVVSSKVIYVLFQPQSEGNLSGSLNASSSGETETTNLIGEGVLSILGLAKSKFKIYPNPAEDVLTVDGASSVSELDVMDIYGRVLKHERGGRTLDVSYLEPGIYILRVVTDQNPVYMRFRVR